MKYQRSQAEVSLVAEGIVKRINRVSHKLAENIIFDCDLCQDTGFTEHGGRYKPCRHNQTAKPIAENEGPDFSKVKW